MISKFLKIIKFSLSVVKKNSAYAKIKILTSLEMGEGGGQTSSRIFNIALKIKSHRFRSHRLI